MREQLTVGSMFAGIGGICLAFRQNGCKIVWTNEIDKYACKTYRLNFGDEYLVEGDIQKLDTKDIPKFDILSAGFPCQAFSPVGRLEGFNDPRGNLFFETARVINKIKPRVVFLENVAHLFYLKKMKNSFISKLEIQYVFLWLAGLPKILLNR